MKISVLIIAHNEEEWIKRCIESILNQTQKPDEIVLIAHNCTDGTIKIAQNYPEIKLVEYSGPVGIPYARIKGFETVTGDIICCTDGDAWADKNWVKEMAKTLQKNNILVGSWVKFKGTFWGYLSNLSNKYFCTKNKKPERWVWGASFACWGKDKNLIKDILEKSIKLSKELELKRNPEDYWIALFMKKYGKIEITNKTYVNVQTKELSSKELITRSKENIQGGNKIENFIKQNHL